MCHPSNASRHGSLISITKLFSLQDTDGRQQSMPAIFFVESKLHRRTPDIQHRISSSRGSSICAIFDEEFSRLQFESVRRIRDESGSPASSHAITSPSLTFASDEAERRTRIREGSFCGESLFYRSARSRTYTHAHLTSRRFELETAETHFVVFCVASCTTTARPVCFNNTS